MDFHSCDCGKMSDHKYFKFVDVYFKYVDEL